MKDFIPPAQGSCLHLLPSRIQPSSWRWPWGLWTRSPPPNHAPCGPSHYTMLPLIPALPACDRPGAAERALSIRGEGISRGVEGCPALLPDDGSIIVGLGAWGVLGRRMCIFLVIAQATPVVASAASRDSGESQTAGFSRPKGGSIGKQDPCVRQETWNKA